MSKLPSYGEATAEMEKHLNKKRYPHVEVSCDAWSMLPKVTLEITEGNVQDISNMVCRAEALYEVGSAPVIRLDIVPAQFHAASDVVKVALGELDSHLVEEDTK